MHEDKINLLYLDDEENNLQSFKASFRKDYKIFTTTSIQEAERILETESIQIVLADQRMPEMTGVEFFEKIRQIYPDPMRILITGYSDIMNAIDAINKGEVFRFIDKPWDYKLVQNAIIQAFEIYKTRSDLRIRNIQLEKAYEELDKFIYSASHDLRAPLMSIQGIVNLALIKKDVKEQNEYLGLIDQCVRKLDNFIINIIDYYKNSRGETTIIEINLRDLINEITDTVRFLPGYENIDTSIQIQEDTVFKTDPVKMRIILNNLISNAIKYQDENKDTHFIKINVISNAAECIISIEDNGIGIKQDDLENIFKMFHRGRVTNSGSGIGLYIVFEAVTKLNGTINVNSKYGYGTTFIVTLPQQN